MRKPANLTALALARSRLRAALKLLSDAKQLGGWSSDQRAEIDAAIHCGWAIDSNMTFQFGAGLMRGEKSNV